MNMTWTQLSAVDSVHRPSARDGHGFASAGAKLYVHGGWNGGNKFVCLEVLFRVSMFVVIFHICLLEINISY